MKIDLLMTILGFLSLLAALLAIVAMPASAQYVWSGNISVGNDTFIWCPYEENFGTEERLYMNCDVDSGEQITIVGMDLSGLPEGEGAWISSAILWLYYGGYDGNESPAGSLVKIALPTSEYASSWTELGATWLTVNGDLYWDSGGARPVSQLDSNYLPAEAGWVSLDVTDLCSGVYGNTNYAIGVIGYYDDSCTSDFQAWFASRENSISGERPYIEISIGGLPEPTPTPTPEVTPTPTPTPEVTPTPTPTESPTPTAGAIVINILSDFDPIPIVILAVAIALTLISTKGKSPFLWFITAFAWVALMCVWVNPWIVGISVLMAVTSLGLFVTSKGGR